MIDMNDDTTAMLILLPICGLVFGALGIGLFLVIRDTRRRRGGFGINTQAVDCPCCGDPAPQARVPANFRQFLWGGATCENCGLEFDKWGQALDDRELKRLRDLFDNPYDRPQPSQARSDNRIKPPGHIA